MKEIYIVGNGGLAKDVCALVQKEGWNIKGFIDIEDNNSGYLGIKVIAEDSFLQFDSPLNIVFAIGNPHARKKLVEKYSKNKNLSFPSIVSKDAIVYNAIIGEGCVVCAGNILMPDVKIHDFAYINIGCTIGHDDYIDEYATINPGVNISGNVKIGELCDIGTGVSIIPGINVGENTVIGAGTVVIKDCEPNSTYVGNPAKKIK